MQQLGRRATQQVGAGELRHQQQHAAPTAASDATAPNTRPLPLLRLPLLLTHTVPGPTAQEPAVLALPRFVQASESVKPVSCVRHRIEVRVAGGVLVC